MSIKRADQLNDRLGFRIPGTIFRRMVAHLASALPNEGVGLLATDAEGVDTRAVAFYPGTNIDQSPTRYTMEAAEVIAAIGDIQANDWHLGAIVHSHVSTAPTPSVTDLREAFYPDSLMLIVGFAGGVAEARLWRLEPDRTGIQVREALLLIGDDD